MNKITGIELIRHLHNNELKMNTKINVYYDDVFKTTLTFDGYDLNWKPGTFKVAYLYDGLCDFEIVEDKKIEKITTISVPMINNDREKNIKNVTETLEKYWFSINEIIDRLNELEKEGER